MKELKGRKIRVRPTQDTLAPFTTAAVLSTALLGAVSVIPPRKNCRQPHRSPQSLGNCMMAKCQAAYIVYSRCSPNRTKSVEKLRPHFRYNSSIPFGHAGCRTRTTISLVNLNWMLPGRSCIKISNPKPEAPSARAPTFFPREPGPALPR